MDISGWMIPMADFGVVEPINAVVKYSHADLKRYRFYNSYKQLYYYSFVRDENERIILKWILSR